MLLEQAAHRPLFEGSDPVLTSLWPCRRYVAIGAVIGLLLGAIVYRLTVPIYTASVTVELSEVGDQIDLNPAGGQLDVVTQDTDAQIVRSDVVVQAVSAASGAAPGYVRQALGVSARPLSRVLDIRYTDVSEKAALAGAAAAGTAFLAERDRVVIAPMRTYLNDIVTTTEPLDRSSADQQRSSAVNREITRDRAFSELLRLPSAGTQLQAAAMTAVADRGDLEVPLTSGVMLGALIGLAVGMVRIGTLRLPYVPRSWVRPVLHDRRSRRVPEPVTRKRLLAGSAAIMLIAGGMGWAAASQVSPSYLGKANVLIKPTPGAAYSGTGGARRKERDMTTEAQLVTSDDVLSRVAAGSDVTYSVAQLRARVSASIVPHADVISITVKGPTQQVATDLARRCADAYTQVRARRSAATSLQRRTILDAEVAKIEEGMKASATAPGRAEALDLYNARLSRVRADYGWAVQTDPVGESVISSGGKPDKRTTYLRIAVLGLFLLGGVAVALLTRGGTRRRMPGRRVRPRTRSAWRGVRTKSV